MPKVYSEDLRRRVLAAYETTNATYEEVAARFGVSVGFVRKLRELHKETGGITRRPHGGGMPRKLSPDDEKAIRRWCEVQPDLTLKEYQERLHTERGVEVSTMTLSRVLREMGLTRKKSPSTRPSSGRRKSG